MQDLNAGVNRALVLLSGGLDSSVGLFEAAANHKKIVTLTVDYGQMAYLKEKQAALHLAKKVGAESYFLNFKWLTQFSNSALQKGGKILPKQVNLENLKTCQQTAKAVWVPNRNALLINTAASLCEFLKIKNIVVGFNAEEALTFKDNSAEFLQAINQSLKYSTSRETQVLCYTLNLNKKQIWQKAKNFGLSYKQLWSCYKGEKKPCRKCESCLRLQRAME